VGAVDQPGPAGGAGPGGDQRGDRDARAALSGHPHDGGGAAAAPGAVLSEPWPDSSSKQSQAPQVRRPFMTGQGLLPPRGDGVLVPFGSAAGRDLDAHPIRCSSTSSPASVYSIPNRPRTSSPIRARVQHWSFQPQAAAPHPARTVARESACTGPRRRPWRPAPLSRRLPASAAIGSISATPGSAWLSPGRMRLARSVTPRPAAPAHGAPAPAHPGRRHLGTSCIRHSSVRRPSPGLVPPQAPSCPVQNATVGPADLSTKTCRERDSDPAVAHHKAGMAQ
jgi:hypothetical protein